MPDYKNGKIYALRVPGIDDIYIGSTCETLSRRFSNHKSKYLDFINGKYRFTTSFLLLGFEDCYIELIKNFPCDSKEELNKKEGEIIRKTNKCINKRIESRTKKEYNEDNIEIRKQWFKEYYETLRECFKEGCNEKVRLWRAKKSSKIISQSEV